MIAAERCASFLASTPKGVMSHCSARFVLIAAALGLAPGAVVASAAPWSPPTVLRAKCDPKTPDGCPVEPSPRVAVNAHGVVATTWVDTHGRNGSVRAVVDDGHGRAGDVVVAWRGGGGRLQFARRAKGATGFSSPATLVAVHAPRRA